MSCCKDLILGFLSLFMFLIGFYPMLMLKDCEWSKHLNIKSRSAIFTYLNMGYFSILCVSLFLKWIIRPRNVFTMFSKPWMSFINLIWGASFNLLVSYAFPENTWMELVATCLLAYSMFFLCEMINAEHSGTFEILTVPCDVFWVLFFYKIPLTDTSIGWKVFFIANCVLLTILRVFPHGVEEEEKCQKAQKLALEAYRSHLYIQNLFEKVSLENAHEESYKLSVDLYHSTIAEVAGSTKKRHEEELQKVLTETFEDFKKANIEVCDAAEQMERALREASDSDEDINEFMKAINDVVRPKYEASCGLENGQKLALFLMTSLEGAVHYFVKRITSKRKSFESSCKEMEDAINRLELENCTLKKNHSSLEERLESREKEMCKEVNSARGETEQLKRKMEIQELKFKDEILLKQQKVEELQEKCKQAEEEAKSAVESAKRSQEEKMEMLRLEEERSGMVLQENTLFTLEMVIVSAFLKAVIDEKDDRIEAMSEQHIEMELHLMLLQAIIQEGEFL